MIKICILVFLPVLLTMPVYSQNANPVTKQERRIAGIGSLSGTVTDATGTPLPRASVFIHEIKAGAIANDSGRYTTSRIAGGKYLIEVSHQGYASHIEAVVVAGDTHKDFALSSIIVEQEGVTVTGVSSATRLKQSPQPVSILKKTDFLKEASTNLIDALTRKSGIAAISTGPAISKPVIRGLGYNRVVVVNDGVRQEGQQWGDEHGIEIDEYSVQKAEILKGPASLMYGSDAMAGVINFLTNQVVEPGAFTGNILATTNTNNRLYGFNANVAAHSKNGFNWNVYSTLKSAGDYRNKYDGLVLNSRFNEKNIGGYIGINKNWGYSHLLISSVNQRFGLIEGNRDSASGKFVVFSGRQNEHIASADELKSRDLLVPYQTINHNKIALDNSLAIGSGRLTAVVAYQVNKRREYGDPAFTTIPGVYFHLTTFNYNIAYHFSEKRDWKTSAGVNGMYQQNKNLAEERLIPEYNLFDGGAFIYTKKNFNKLTLSGGIRGDMRHLNSKEDKEDSQVKFAGYQTTFSSLSGSAGATYELSKTVLFRLNIARGFRAPGIAELSSNGAHEGTNRYEYGQKNLKTETSLQADAGFELNTVHFNLGFSAYYNNISNYIYYRKLQAANGGDSTVKVNGDELTAFRFDQSGARLTGFEANFDLHPHPLDWLHFENTVSFVSGRFNKPVEGANRLPFIPAPRWLSELRADFGKAGLLRNLYFKLEMDATARQGDIFYAYNTETPTNGYTLLNAGSGAEVMSRGSKLFSLYLSLNNFTNVAYQNHLSRLKYTDINNTNGLQGVFNMGRNFNVKINIPLNFVRKSAASSAG